MRTIAEQWDIFNAAVIPATAGATQRREMQRAFYAGVCVALTSAGQAADESGDNDDVGATKLQLLFDECTRFFRGVEQGRA